MQISMTYEAQETRPFIVHGRVFVRCVDNKNRPVLTDVF